MIFEERQIPSENVSFDIVNVIAKHNILYIADCLEYINDISVFNNLFVYSARFSHNDVFEYLLQKKVNVNFRGVKGYTALIWAVRNNNNRMVYSLLQNKKTNIKVLNHRSYSALDFARWNSNMYIIHLLEKHNSC